MSVWTVPAVLTGLAVALTGWAAYWWRVWRRPRPWRPAPGDLDRLVCDIREHIAMEWLRDEMADVRSRQWRDDLDEMSGKPRPTGKELHR